LAFTDGGIMDQPGNSAKKGNKAGSDSSASTHQYLVYIHVYKEQINQISQSINLMPQWELVSNYGRVKNVESEIADVIHNLETLSGNPLGRSFNRRAVLGHLNNARVEINIASHLAGSTSRLTSAKCFEHIVKCRDHLNRAKTLMP
jgi:hypothetical protein